MIWSLQCIHNLELLTTLCLFLLQTHHGESSFVWVQDLKRILILTKRCIISSEKDHYTDVIYVDKFSSLYDLRMNILNSMITIRSCFLNSLIMKYQKKTSSWTHSICLEISILKQIRCSQQPMSIFRLTLMKWIICLLILPIECNIQMRHMKN